MFRASGLIIFFVIFAVSSLRAQLLVAPNGSGDTLARAIMGPSATISNIYFRCHTGASGFALGTNSNLPLDTSVVLSNGLITSAMGPNINTATSDVFAPPQDGDTILSGFIPDTIPTEDACVLQFRYIPKVSPFSVHYVFASDEYPEYVCCPTADRFGFFIVGPNPTNVGPPNFFYNDFAVIPNSNPPIPTLLNSVNPGQVGSAPCVSPAGCISLSNSLLYNDNTGSTTEEFDGYTDALQGEVPVYPCSTYTIRFAIADGGDATVNSYVFIETSTQNARPYTMSLTSNLSAPYVIEGCLGGSLTISIANDNPFDLTLLLDHYGSAINGVDYSLPDTAIIPAGATSVSIPFTPFLDSLIENSDTIKIALRLPCTGWLDSVKIAIKDSLTLSVSSPQVMCPGDTIQIEANSPGMLQWEPNYNISNTIAEDPLIYPMVDTVYSVTATLLGCQSTAMVPVHVREAPFVDAGSDTGNCAGQFLYLNASVDPDVVVHFWSPPTGLSNITLLDPMLIPDQSRYYTLWVRDIHGCVNTDSVFVEVYPFPVVDAGPNKTICLGDSIQLDGTGDGTFEWSPKAFLSNITAEDPWAFPDQTTTFQLFLTDSNGCRSGDQVKVKVRDLPAVKAGPDITICVNDTALLTASGAKTYYWKSSPWLLDSIGASVRARPIITADFVVFGTDKYNCENSDTVRVFTQDAPQVAALASTLSACPGDTILLSASGAGEQYKWFSSALIFDVDSSITKAVVTKTSRFLVMTTDSLGCRGYDSVWVTVHDIPQISTGGSDSICLGDSIQLNAGGGVLYQWSPAASLSDPASASPVASPQFTTTYTLQVQNSFGCSGTDSTTIVVLPLPQAIAGSDTSICFGSEAILKASGGQSYLWSPASEVDCDTCRISKAYPTTTQVFTLAVTDKYGCKDEDQMTVSILSLPVPNANASQPDICYGDSVLLGASGGIIYHWEPAGLLDHPAMSMSTAWPDTTTWFTVFVNDQYSCQGIDSVLVRVHGLPNAITINDDSVCVGSSIQLEASGGSFYHWSPGDFLNDSTIANPIATPVASTTFTVMISDVMGCSTSDEISIHVLPLPQVSATTASVACFGDSLQLSAAGAKEYQWTPIANLSCSTCPNPRWQVAKSTTFTVWGEDAFGCRNFDTSHISVRPLPLVVAGPDTIICPDQRVRLSASGAKDFLWSPALYLDNPAISGPVSTPVDPIQYTVTGTDSFGCRNRDSVNIQFFPGSNVTAGPDLFICEGDSVELQGSGADFYDWSPAQWLDDSTKARPLARPASSTLFTVRGSSSNGCQSTDEMFVTVYSRPTLTLSADSLFICPGDSASLEVSGADTYHWYPGSFVSDSTAAMVKLFPEYSQYFTLDGFSNEGCLKRKTIYVNVAPVIDPAVRPKEVSVCLGDTLQFYATPGYAYHWFPEEDFVDPLVGDALLVPENDRIYWLELRDSFNCPFYDSVKVFVLEPAYADAGPDLSIYEGESIRLHGQGNGSFLWTPSKWLDNTGIQDPLASPDSSITYTLLVTTDDNCKARDKVRIRVYLETQVWFANAFSPNGDGKNDLFGPEIYNEIEMEYFAIYDRWGKRLFYTQTPGEKWDGRIGGYPAPVGTYIYEFKAKGNRDKPFFKHGNFTLIR